MADKRDGGRFLILGSCGYFYYFVSMLSFRGCPLSFSTYVSDFLPSFFFPFSSSKM